MSSQPGGLMEGPQLAQRQEGKESEADRPWTRATGRNT